MASFTWQSSTIVDNLVVTTNPSTELLGHLNTVINASATGGYWQVASYISSSPRSLLLKRTDGSPGRIVIFGQTASTPFITSVRNISSSGASLMYIAFSETSTSNTVDASWLSAPPLSASDYLQGMSVGSMQVGTYRIYYMEHQDGICFVLEQPDFGQYIAAGAGKQFTSAFDGQHYYCVYGHGNVSTSSTPQIFGASGANEFSTVNNPGMLARFPFEGLTNNWLLQNQDTYAQHPIRQMSSLARATTEFWPYVLSFSGQYGFGMTAGRARQMAHGMYCLRETNLYDAETGILEAHGLSPTLTAWQEGLWLTNFEVA